MSANDYCAVTGRPLTTRQYCHRCRRVVDHTGDYDPAYRTVVRYCTECPRRSWEAARARLRRTA